MLKMVGVGFSICRTPLALPHGNTTLFYEPPERHRIIRLECGALAKRAAVLQDETTPEVLVEGRSIATPRLSPARLSPDGPQVLYLSYSNPDDASAPGSLMSRPLMGGTPLTIIQGKGIYPG